MLLLAAHDFLVRRFRQTRHSLRFGFSLMGYSAGFVAVMLMHLFLMLVEIEFVQARAAPDLVSLDVSCLTFHSFLPVTQTRVSDNWFFLPLPLGEGRGAGMLFRHASHPPPNPSHR